MCTPPTSNDNTITAHTHQSTWQAKHHHAAQPLATHVCAFCFFKGGGGAAAGGGVEGGDGPFWPRMNCWCTHKLTHRTKGVLHTCACKPCKCAWPRPELRHAERRRRASTLASTARVWLARATVCASAFPSRPRLRPKRCYKDRRHTLLTRCAGPGLQATPVLTSQASRGGLQHSHAPLRGLALTSHCATGSPLQTWLHAYALYTAPAAPFGSKQLSLPWQYAPPSQSSSVRAVPASALPSAFLVLAWLSIDGGGARGQNPAGSTRARVHRCPSTRGPSASPTEERASGVRPLRAPRASQPRNSPPSPTTGSL